jgi:hypothetical protein
MTKSDSDDVRLLYTHVELSDTKVIMLILKLQLDSFIIMIIQSIHPSISTVSRKELLHRHWHQRQQ